MVGGRLNQIHVNECQIFKVCHYSIDFHFSNQPLIAFGSCDDHYVQPQIDGIQCFIFNGNIEVGLKWIFCLV